MLWIKEKNILTFWNEFKTSQGLHFCYTILGLFKGALIPWIRLALQLSTVTRNQSEAPFPRSPISPSFLLYPLFQSLRIKVSKTHKKVLKITITIYVGPLRKHWVSRVKSNTFYIYDWQLSLTFFCRSFQRETLPTTVKAHWSGHSSRAWQSGTLCQAPAVCHEQLTFSIYFPPCT